MPSILDSSPFAPGSAKIKEQSSAYFFFVVGRMAKQKRTHDIYFFVCTYQNVFIYLFLDIYTYTHEYMCECISMLLLYKYDIYFIWYVLHVFHLVLTCITYCISHIIRYRSYMIHQNHISYATYHISCYDLLLYIIYQAENSTMKQQTWMHFPVWQSALKAVLKGSRMGATGEIFKDPLKWVLCKWNSILKMVF